MSITRSIYNMVLQTSRFLKFNEGTNCWEKINSENARDKIGHSLRFANRTNKRKTKKSQHKRTGSCSSQQSDSTDSTCSSDFSQDSILAMFQSPYAPIPLGASSSVLDSVLASTIGADQETSIDDLMQLFKEDQPLHEDPLLDDITSVVQKLDIVEQQQQQTAAAEEENLMNLLNEPIVGEF